MAATPAVPLILPLKSHSRVEAHPADLLAWTDWRGLIATGSPISRGASPEGRPHVITSEQRLRFPRPRPRSHRGRAKAITDTVLAAAERLGPRQ